MAETQDQKGLLAKVWGFIRLFVPLVVLLHIVAFFAINHDTVKINFVYTSRTVTIRPVILVSLAAGVMLTLLVITIRRMMSRRRNSR